MGVHMDFDIDNGEMPQQVQSSWVLYETDATTEDMASKTDLAPTAEKRKLKIVWRNVILMSLLHLQGIYGFYLFFFEAKWQTNLCTVILYILSGFGITAGAHRLWAHKSYKARWPLRLMLTVFNTMAFQNAVLDWARDHRMHHKYSETDADPHNATRGFFFSHVGWLLVRKHPQITAKGHTVDMSDLWADPILRFQKKYYTILMPLGCFGLTSFIPYLLGDSLWNGYFVCAISRYVFGLHATWLINSAAHMFGSKPYDRNINPGEIKSVAFFSLGEGFHNYHHTFPWDYKTAELGNYSLNITKLFIDIMAMIGLAYDLKTVSKEVIEKRVKRTGDGSHSVWGWDDLPQDEKNLATIVKPDKHA